VVWRRSRKSATSRGRPRSLAAQTSASMRASPGTAGKTRWCGGRSIRRIGFAVRSPRLTSQLQKLASVACRHRKVLIARSYPAMSSIHAWIIGSVRSWTRASRPVRALVKSRNCSRFQRYVRTPLSVLPRCFRWYWQNWFTQSVNRWVIASVLPSRLRPGFRRAAVCGGISQASSGWESQYARERRGQGEATLGADAERPIWNADGPRRGGCPWTTCDGSSPGDN